MQRDDGPLQAVATALDQPLVTRSLGLLALQSRVELRYVIVYGIAADAF